MGVGEDWQSPGKRRKWLVQGLEKGLVVGMDYEQDGQPQGKQESKIGWEMNATLLGLSQEEQLLLGGRGVGWLQQVEERLLDKVGLKQVSEHVTSSRIGLGVSMSLGSFRYIKVQGVPFKVGKYCYGGAARVGLIGIQ